MEKRTVMVLFLLMMVASCAFCAQLSEYSHVEYTYGWFLEDYDGDDTNPTIVIIKIYFLTKNDMWFKDLMEFISISDEYFPSEGCHWYCIDKDVFEELSRVF